MILTVSIRLLGNGSILSICVLHQIYILINVMAQQKYGLVAEKRVRNKIDVCLHYILHHINRQRVNVQINSSTSKLIRLDENRKVYMLINRLTV